MIQSMSGAAWLTRMFKAAVARILCKNAPLFLPLLNYLDCNSGDIYFSPNTSRGSST